MIVFVPAYDDSTRANLAIAQSIVDDDCLLLFQEKATANILQFVLRNLEDMAMPLFVMAHGTGDFFLDNDDLPALSLHQTHLLSGKSAYVFACFTANHFGKIVASENAIYWGYTGAIQSPDSQPETVVLFKTIFQFILQHFSTSKTLVEIQAIFQLLRNRCDEAKGVLFDLSEQNPDFDLLEASICINHIYERLRVRHPDFEQPLLPPGAPPGDLL